MRTATKQKAVDAFREYGTTGGNNKDLKTAAAVNLMFNYFMIKGDYITIDAVKLVYCSLPTGDVERGAVSAAVAFAAEKLFTNENTIYHKLSQACSIFNKCYEII